MIKQPGGKHQHRRKDKSPKAGATSVNTEGAITTSITGAHGRRYRHQKAADKAAAFAT